MSYAMTRNAFQSKSITIIYITYFFTFLAGVLPHKVIFSSCRGLEIGGIFSFFVAETHC